MNADIHTLAGAYALDALSADEAAYFEQHLTDCDGCAQEVAELQRTVATMASTVASASPPAALRDRVLADARSHPQLPPLTSGTAAATSVTAARSRRRRRPFAAALAGLAVAAAVAGLAVSGADVWPFNDQNSTGVATGPAQQIARVVNAPDVRSASANIRGGGKLAVYRSPSLGETAVVLRELPPLDPSLDYQMWLLNARGPTSIAVVPRDDPRPQMLLKNLKPGWKIAITREPAGGSPAPTTAPLASVTAV